MTSTESVVTGPVDALTADGGIVTIRPVRVDDHEALDALYREASPDSLRLRFFGFPGPGTITTEVDRVCRPDSDRHLAVLAAQGGRIIGVASCESTGDTGHRAEFAAFVADAHRGRGIGTLLLEHLTARARRHGIDELVGEVLPGNVDMLKVARDLTGHPWSRFDDGVVDVGLPTAADLETEGAIDIRDRIAERASLHPLFAPASVAVAGAGHHPGGVGHETLRGLREYGFTGTLYAINRGGTPVGGVAGYRSLGDLPAPVDLLVVAVPADQVTRVLTDGAEAGVRAAVVLSAGFGEAGPDGRRRQHELVRFAREHGI